MRVLIVYHTFTGQAGNVADSAAQLIRARSSEALLCRVDFADVTERHQPPVPFSVIKRWSDEAKGGILKPISLDPEPPTADKFDAVILLSNTWNWHPSAPIQSLLKSARARELFAGKPVGIGIVCRGFWKNNLAMTKALVQAAGGRVIAEEVFTHAGSWLRSTIINILRMTKPAPLRTRIGPFRLPPFGVSPDSMAKIPSFVARLFG